MCLIFTFIFLICVVISRQSCPKLVAEFSQVNCTNQATSSSAYYYYLNELESCIPSCHEYQSSYLSVRCAEDNPCPPAYFCDQRCSGSISNLAIKCTQDSDCPSARSKCQFFCIAETGGCMAYHANTEDFLDTYWTALKFKPTCNNDGTWAAKQCKGGLSGRCMCFDSAGNRLFGEALYSESKDMTCACSRKKADLLASGRPFVTLHCDSKGNFEKLQCDSGQCWCVEPKTGELTAPVVPEKAMAKLPCYSATEVGSQYLRQCDSKKYALSNIANKLKIHGVKFVSQESLLCDDDGSYGAYNISSGIAYCTWRDGSKIGTWQANTEADFSTLNCNCAKDYKRYNHNQQCEGNGNYKVLQQVITSELESYYYCADSDGFPKSFELEDNTVDCSQYY